MNEEPWRSEPLTKGEVYDILMNVAAEVEENNKKNIGPKMSKLLKLHLIREMIENAAKSLSKSDWERCPGWLSPAGKTQIHPRCEYGPCQHYGHYIPPEVSDGV